ncbi:hypothetical protein LINPERHAP2_LOCUS3193 [Linum perenne]
MIPSHRSSMQTGRKTNAARISSSNSFDPQNNCREDFKKVKEIPPDSSFNDHSTVLSQIEIAEELGNCTIDFQI